MTSPITLDHLVIGAASLEQGARYIRECLDVVIPKGGAHPLMGTHNLLMRLGDAAFLEVIAIDPAAPPPSRKRWYGLDDPELQSRITISPMPIAWVVRSGDIIRNAALCGYSSDEIIKVSRGDLSWQLTVPDDGHLPWGGALPHVIEWDGGVRPWEQMADFGFRLDRLTLSHPDVDGLAGALQGITLSDIGPIALERSASPVLSFGISNSNGSFTL